MRNFSFIFVFVTSERGKNIVEVPPQTKNITATQPSYSVPSDVEKESKHSGHVPLRPDLLQHYW